MNIPRRYLGVSSGGRRDRSDAYDTFVRRRFGDFSNVLIQSKVLRAQFAVDISPPERQDDEVKRNGGIDCETYLELTIDRQRILDGK